MHITIITSEFAPFVEKSPLANEVVRFACALKRIGHTTTVFMPFSNGIDVHTHSLARRLMPIKASVFGEPLTCFRFDGRTPDGIEVLFLDIDGAKEKPADVSNDILFFHAACEVMVGQSSIGDATIALGAEATGFAEVAEQNEALEQLPVIAALYSLDGNTSEAVVRALESMDRIVLNQHRLFAATLDERLLPLKEMLSKGHIQWLAIPGQGEDQLGDKPSQKAAFQMKWSLPMRADVPLVAFMDGDEAALSVFLTSDVQAAVTTEIADLDALKERYPDRLVVLQKEELSSLLAFDACVCNNERGLMATSMLAGSVPIVSQNMEDEAVDLDAALASGSAIVLPTSASTDLTAGLERLVVAYQSRQAFSKLQSRLPSYANTWEKAAALLIELVKEISLEKKRDGQTD